MSFLAIDLGQHSIKFAKSSENNAQPEHFEILFETLIDPNNQIVAVGNDAIDRYLKRDLNTPRGVRLFKEDLREKTDKKQLQPDQIMAAFFKKARESFFSNDRFELIIVTFTHDIFVDNNDYVETILNLIKDTFKPNKVVALNEHVSAASSFHVSSDIKLQEGIICDLGKKHLKLSYFKAENNVIVFKNQKTEPYSNLEDCFLNELNIPAGLPEPQKIQVLKDFRTAFFGKDKSEHYFNALDNAVMNDDDGGLQSLLFFEFPLPEELKSAGIKNAFSYKDVYTPYSTFANGIVKRIDGFIAEIDGLKQTNNLAVYVIGAPARVIGFDHLLNQNSMNISPSFSFYLPPDPKHAIVNDSISVVLNNIKIYPDFTVKLQYKKKLIKNGKIVYIMKDIETAKTLNLGERKELSSVLVDSSTSNTGIYQNGKELNSNDHLTKGKYSLWQSVSRFGMPVFYLIKRDDANTNPIILKKGEQQNV